MSAPQSVARLIHILEVLCASAVPVGLAHLSRAIGAPKSSVAALMRGLTETQVVVTTDAGFRLGPGAFGLGSALMEARRRLQSSDLVRAGMRRLAERSGETVLLAVRDARGAMMTYVDTIESRNAVRFAVTVGDRRPLYCTAGGRALLAADSDKDLRRYFEPIKPRRLTLHTEINKRRLMEAIAAVRTGGVAQTFDQAADGVTGTAAVIRDASGAVIGALVVAAPSARLMDGGVELAGLVREAAGGISRSLGHRTPSAG